MFIMYVSSFSKVFFYLGLFKRVEDDIVIQLKRIRKVSPTQGCKDGTEAMLHLRAKQVNVG